MLKALAALRPVREASASDGARAAGGLQVQVAPSLDISALYRRYGDMVLSRCRTLLRNEADAQDACQEIFLKAYRYRDSFRGDASPSTWLFRIATTTCLNTLRSRRRRPEDPVEEMPPQPSVDSVLDQLAVRQLLDLLLGEQDERTRDCMVYHYVDGMTHEEVGDLLGISAAAVRKRIHVFRSSIQDHAPAWLLEASS